MAKKHDTVAEPAEAGPKKPGTGELPNGLILLVAGSLLSVLGWCAARWFDSGTAGIVLSAVRAPLTVSTRVKSGAASTLEGLPIYYEGVDATVLILHNLAGKQPVQVAGVNVTAINRPLPTGTTLSYSVDLDAAVGYGVKEVDVYRVMLGNKAPEVVYVKPREGTGVIPTSASNIFKRQDQQVIATLSPDGNDSSYSFRLTFGTTGPGLWEVHIGADYLVGNATASKHVEGNHFFIYRK